MIGLAGEGVTKRTHGNPDLMTETLATIEPRRRPKRRARQLSEIEQLQANDPVAAIVLPPSSTVPTQVDIFDRSTLMKQLELAYGREYLFEKEEEYSMPQPVLAFEEQTRLDRLRRLAADDRGPKRDLLFGSFAIRERLAGVRTDCPSFAEVVDLIDRAVALSMASGAPVSVPPILLAGPPGTGKTHASKAIAAALGVAIQAHSCATNSDAQQLLIGHPTTWKGARMSVVNEALLGGDTAQPVLLLDELDKFQTHRDEQPYHVLLTLLEVENSRALLDEYLRVSFDLSRAIVIATANDVHRLPGYIRDRLVMFDIAPLTGDALLSVTRRIAMIAIAETNNLMQPPADAVITRLARANSRRITRVVRLALGYAAAACRDHLTVADVEAADQLGEPAIQGQPMGFLGGGRGD